MRYYHEIEGTHQYDYHKFYFSSSTVNKLTYNQGSHIGYSKIIEKTGEKLRSMMPWITANALVDKEKN